MGVWPVLIPLVLVTACAPLRRVELPFKSGPVARGCPLSDEAATASAIRSPDASVRLLLIEGCRNSPTLRRLAEAIGRTDGIVYVATGRCRLPTLRGCLLHTIEDTGQARYLWIRVGANADSRELVATMAHEMQHALEVLTREGVRSERDFLDLYQSLGSSASGGPIVTGPYRAFETRAALEIGAAVWAELAASRADVSADDRD
jgi:hypothetical protein